MLADWLRWHVGLSGSFSWTPGPRERGPMLCVPGAELGAACTGRLSAGSAAETPAAEVGRTVCPSRDASIRITVKHKTSSRHL